jgi:hypothetical protein
LFTTGNHIYLYAACAVYVISTIAFFAGRRNISLAVLVAGTAVYSLYLLGRGWIAGFFLTNPLVEGPFFLPWITSILAIYLAKKKDESWGLILLMLIAFAGFALYYSKGIMPPSPNKIGTWVTVFFMTEISAHCLFMASGVYAAAFLIRGTDAERFHVLAIWGFVLYSIAQVSGALWCYQGWGGTFRWGNRHMLSAAVWMIYAAYIHTKYINWDRRQRSWYVIAAAAAVAYTSFWSYLHEMTFPRIGG